MTIGVRPISSGSSCSLIANPTVSRGSSVAGASPSGIVAKIVACGLITPSVPPDHTIGTCLTCVGGRALLDEHLAEGAVGDDPRVVVDAAVALGLADDRDDPVGVQHAVVDELRELAGVGDGVDRDLAYFDRGWHELPSFLGRWVRTVRWTAATGGTTRVPAFPATASESRSSEVIAPVPPVRSTNRATASTFGPMEPAANCCSVAITRSAVASTSSIGRAVGVPQSATTFSTSVAMTRTSASTCSASSAAVRSLSITASMPS